MDAVLEVHALLLHAQAGREAPPLEEMLEATRRANDPAQSAYRILSDLGGRSPDMPRPSGTPLHLLSTKSSRGLLEALRAALGWAEEVDKERGNTVPEHYKLGPDEPRGSVWAEDVGMLLFRCRAEVEGSRGGGRE